MLHILPLNIAPPRRGVNLGHLVTCITRILNKRISFLKTATTPHFPSLYARNCFAGNSRCRTSFLIASHQYMCQSSFYLSDVTCIFRCLWNFPEGAFKINARCPLRFHALLARSSTLALTCRCLPTKIHPVATNSRGKSFGRYSLTAMLCWTTSNPKATRSTGNSSWMQNRYCKITSEELNCSFFFATRNVELPGYGLKHLLYPPKFLCVTFQITFLSVDVAAISTQK